MVIFCPSSSLSSLLRTLELDLVGQDLLSEAREAARREPFALHVNAPAHRDLLTVRA